MPGPNDAGRGLQHGRSLDAGYVGGMATRPAFCENQMADWLGAAVDRSSGVGAFPPHHRDPVVNEQSDPPGCPGRAS